MTINFILQLIALFLFALAALGIAPGPINLALERDGLFCWLLSTMIPARPRAA